MALKKVITTEQGAVLSYWNISRIGGRMDGKNKTIHVTLGGYKDETWREKSAKPIADTKRIVLSKATVDKVLTLIYEDCLKQQEEFVDAVDVLTDTWKTEEEKV